MINLSNFGIKTVVDIVVKYDNSQIKMKKNFPSNYVNLDSLLKYNNLQNRNSQIIEQNTS